MRAAGGTSSATEHVTGVPCITLPRWPRAAICGQTSALEDRGWSPMGSRRSLPAPPTADDSGTRPMDFQQVVQQRRMVRAFREEPLAPEVVERILANGNRAPSAGFTQGYAFLALERANDRARLWETMAAAG